MSQEINNDKYKIEKPPIWVPIIENVELISNINENNFSKEQRDQGKDFCYFLRKIIYTDNGQNSEYSCMVYSVEEPSTLDFASVNEYVLLPSEHISFHRIAVFRDGEWIDKLSDTQFRVLDNENNSMDGVLGSTKKVNFTIKDIRLNDVLIVEDTRTLLFTDKDFLRKQFFKYIWTTPDVYWGYVKYEFELINNRSQEISFKKLFFRDDKGELLNVEEGRVIPNARYTLTLENYINPIDVNREVYAFVDFSTTSSYEELLTSINGYYYEVFNTKQLVDYAPDLMQKLNDYGDDLDCKVQYALEYVQNSVRYIYNEEEMHGQKPQSPWETYLFKQGDCKAKTVLLKCILDYLNIESEVVLVNYEADFFLNSYLPSLFNFNHVILKINYKDQVYFEDATVKEEYGRLGHRNNICFINYLPIGEKSKLVKRSDFIYLDYALSDKVLFEVIDGVGYISMNTTYKYGRANHMRKSFKNTNKKVIIDSMNNFVYNSLDLGDNGFENDKRKVFEDTQVKVIIDDKDFNVFTVEYKSKITSPYIKTPSNDLVLKYYDSGIVKPFLKDYVHKDFPVLQTFEKEFYNICIRTDKPLVQDNTTTNYEIHLDNEFFKFITSKYINKYDATVDISFLPVNNIEIPVDEIVHVRENYATIEKSHFGLGIVIAKPSFLDRIFSVFQ